MSAASALSPYRVQHEPRLVSATAAASVADKVRIGGSAIIRVISRSMSPWVLAGDQVFVRRFDFSQVVAGDIILYERANRIFIHRVIRRVFRPNREGTASFLTVAGSALDRGDIFVSAEEFLGRATRIHRGKRHIDLESFSRSVLSRILAKFSEWTLLVHRPLLNPGGSKAT